MLLFLRSFNLVRLFQFFLPFISKLVEKLSLQKLKSFVSQICTKQEMKTF